MWCTFVPKRYKEYNTIQFVNLLMNEVHFKFERTVGKKSLYKYLSERHMSNIMQVVKRSGEREPVMFDKISMRMKKLLWNISENNVDCAKIAQKICASIYDGIHTSTIDELASETAQSMILLHPDYGTLAARIVVSNMHKNTQTSLVDVYNELHKNRLVSSEFMELIMKHHDVLEKNLDYDMDYNFDYFGFKTLER